MKYFKVGVLGLAIYGLLFSYMTWQGIPGAVNKAVADTGIILMVMSMWLSSLCYFFNFFDTQIVYRKHLGLIGYAFGLVHIGLSFSALKSLFMLETWQRGVVGPALAGLAATVIFSAMALISNSYAATKLGGKIWRYILRTGYLAVIFVLLHVVLLKSARWGTWFAQGMPTPPSVSLLVSIFMVVVLIMRLALWIDTSRKPVA